MKNVLVFSGTTEGRTLSEMLVNNGFFVTVCVATEYGRQVMPEIENLYIHTGRLDEEQMQKIMHDKNYMAVIDATHPFATEVSKNIRTSAEMCSIPYFRLKRDTKTGHALNNKIIYFSSNDECAKALLNTPGNVFLSTGSKHLNVYCKDEELRKRLYVRVLPNDESIALCYKNGLSGKQIIAMQGPFSVGMNEVIIRDYDIEVFVTKESGDTGGFYEKIKAAERQNISLYVISNPENDDGLSFDEVIKELENLSDIQIKTEHDDIQPFFIKLIGIGMGNINTVTVEAKEAIAEADLIFGAKRILTDVLNWNITSNNAKTYQYYMADDIIPLIEKIDRSKSCNAVVLFSGDSGFYSGCRDLYERLNEWSNNRQNVSVNIIPGISSVSYFASAIHVSWHDAVLISIHGIKDENERKIKVLSAVKNNKKVFVLISDVSDLRMIGTILSESRIDDAKIIVGYNLSYPDEKIEEYTCGQCMGADKDGLYILAILRDGCDNKYLIPHNTDSDFIRGSVPMTKEEIRTLAISKLRLTEEAVVFDIGSGTGSVAVEIAGLSDTVSVLAVEKNEEAVRLIEQNKDKFGLSNIEIIHGSAPEALDGLMQPTHAFIGGSSGALTKIADKLYQMNPEMTVVITAISLETVSEITQIIESMPTENAEIIQVQVSRSKKAGNHNLMQAENPVYICSFKFSKK